MTFEGNIKGIHLINTMNYIKHKRGVIGLQQFLDIVNEGRGPNVIDESSFVEKDWYPYMLYLELLKTADRVVGSGDMAKCYDIGYWTVQHLGHLSYLARAPDVFDFVKSATDNWKNVYDFGRPESIREDDNRLILRYHGFPVDKAKDKYFLGSLSGMLELCQLPNGKVEQTRTNKGVNDYSEYVISWG